MLRFINPMLSIVKKEKEKKGNPMLRFINPMLILFKKRKKGGVVTLSYDC